MEMKIFVKSDCPNCDREKEIFNKLDTKGLDIKWFDTDTAEGLAQASFYNIVDMPTFIIVKDNNEVYNSTKCVSQDELNSLL